MSSSTTGTSESTTGPAAQCGDGIVGADEQCDDMGESATCNADCTVSTCGDTVVNTTAGEECDDGAESPTCDSDCSAATCGDAVVNASAGEACDDGNNAGGDACSAACEETKIVDMALGTAHTCAVFADGVSRCWGENSDGQLGYGNTENLGDQPGELPTPPVPVGDEVLSIGAGAFHGCARLTTGGPRCWGRGGDGQLGYGNLFNLGDDPGELPPSEVDLGAEVLQLAGGDAHTCALVSGGDVHCWGQAVWGQLGYGDKTPRTQPGPAVPAIVQAVEISLGFMHTCALVQGGEVRCWGYNGDGQLGIGNTNAIGDAPNEMPLPANVGGAAVQVAAGNHTCAVLESGTLRCWGHNAYGKLGYGSTTNLGDGPGELPRPDVDLGGLVTRVAVGYSHTCALMANKRVKCWGDGQYGSLGYANPDVIGDDPGEMPPPDVELGGDAVMLWSHLGHGTCALLADDSLRCWGRNDAGQLGYGHFDNIGDDETPESAGPVPF